MGNRHILNASTLIRGAAIFYFMILGLGACGGGGGGQPPPPPPPANAASVTLSISSSSTRVGDSVTLQWASTHATACTASGDWTGPRQTSGSEAVTATDVGAATFMLNCTGPGGSGTASASLNTLPAIREVIIPGVPAPVALASGECQPSTEEEFTIECVTAASGIAAIYDTFSGDLSGRVTLSSLDATPAVTTGGACSAGFDRTLSQFSLMTPFGDDHLPITGTTITEIIYSSSFLASLGVQDIITSMSVLLFFDNSNTEHVGMIIHVDGSDGPLTFAVGGTIASDDSGGFDLVTCFSADEDTPPPTGLNCPAGSGSGYNGLEFLPGQQLAYQISDSAPNSTTQGSLTWGVRFNNPALEASAYTGSLRVSLWALETTFPGSGPFSGYQLLEALPSFTGQGARSANQLYNFYSVSDIVSSSTGTNPPAGDYCMVILLEMFDPDRCDTEDDYCYADWLQFEGAETF